MPIRKSFAHGMFLSSSEVFSVSGVVADRCCLHLISDIHGVSEGAPSAASVSRSPTTLITKQMFAVLNHRQIKMCAEVQNESTYKRKREVAGVHRGDLVK